MTPAASDRVHQVAAHLLGELWQLAGLQLL
jgi:hypothetical protein